MTKQIDKLDELEQLSLLLDEINAGRNPQCDHAETSELLRVAELLRQDVGVIHPPQHILDQTVDRALVGIEAGKKNRPKRLWWYSGAFSTAAAVLLVIGLNLLPSWQNQKSALLPPPATQEQPAPSAQLAPPSLPPTPNTKSSSDYIVPKTADTVQLPVIPAPSPIQTPAPAPQKEPAMASLPSKSEPVTSSSAASVTEDIRPKRYAKSINVMDETSAALSKSTAPEIIPLVLPGNSPDQVIFDKEQGILRQVFFAGTPQEFTVVQRQKTAFPPADKAATIKINSLTIIQLTIAGQDVTLEGHQSPQELRKLAEALTLKP